MWSILKSVFRHAFLTPKRRGFLDGWAVTIVILLASATVVQAFVIPSGSMEGTLLIGDHVLVDRSVYSPADSISRHLLPYRDVRRGDVIVFRYPLDLNKTLVKRAIGTPGDHIRLDNKRVILNGRAVDEPFAKHFPGYMPYRDDHLAELANGRDERWGRRATSIVVALALKHRQIELLLHILSLKAQATKPIGRAKRAGGNHAPYAWHPRRSKLSIRGHLYALTACRSGREPLIEVALAVADNAADSDECGPLAASPPATKSKDRYAESRCDFALVEEGIVLVGSCCHLCSLGSICCYRASD